MKETKKSVSCEEFLKITLDCYDAFRDVMKTCGPEAKRIAIQGFNTMQQIMKERVDLFEEKNGVSFKAMEEALIAANVPMCEEYKELKDKMKKFEEDVNPVIENLVLEKENAKPKKARKRKMESRVRSRE